MDATLRRRLGWFWMCGGASLLLVAVLSWIGGGYDQWGWMAVPHALGLTHTTIGIPDRQVKVVIEQYGETFVASCENGNGSAFAGDPNTAVRDLNALVTMCGETGVDLLLPAVQHHVAMVTQQRSR